MKYTASLFAAFCTSYVAGGLILNNHDNYTRPMIPPVEEDAINSPPEEEELPHRPEIVLDRQQPPRRGRFNLLETEIAERTIYPEEYSEDDVVDGYTLVRPEPNYDLAIRLSELPVNTTKAVVRVYVYPGRFHQSQVGKPSTITARENVNEYIDQVNGRAGRYRKTDVLVAGTYAGSLIPPPMNILPDNTMEEPDPFSYSKLLPGQVDISPFLPFLMEGTEIRLTLSSFQMFRQVKYYDHDLLVKLVTWELDEEIIE